jgi:hypothetical protein
MTLDVFPVPGGPTKIKFGMFPNLTIDFSWSTAYTLPTGNQKLRLGSKLTNNVVKGDWSILLDERLFIVFL